MTPVRISPSLNQALSLFMPPNTVFIWKIPMQAGLCITPII
ncbi:MAG: hypothetical protein U1E92_05885 [Moraxella osloensis]